MQKHPPKPGICSLPSEGQRQHKAHATREMVGFSSVRVVHTCFMLAHTCPFKRRDLPSAAPAARNCISHFCTHVSQQTTFACSCLQT